MSRVLIMLYGLVAYAFAMATIVYGVGFIGNFVVPKTIDSGASVSFGQAVFINLLLLGLFAVQHSVMARPAFKAVWTKWIPQPIERSTYVLFSAIVLALLYHFWQPITDPVWTVTAEPWVLLLLAIYFLGWLIVVFSTFLISHTELFGLQQIVNYWRGSDAPVLAFRTPLLYKIVRHPIYLGFLLAVWATPEMTVGHLLFAVAVTGYIIIGATLEEGDLAQVHGADYRKYQNAVPMLVPWFGRRSSD